MSHSDCFNCCFDDCAGHCPDRESKEKRAAFLRGQRLLESLAAYMEEEELITPDEKLQLLEQIRQEAVL